METWNLGLYWYLNFIFYDMICLTSFCFWIILPVVILKIVKLLEYCYFGFFDEPIVNFSVKEPHVIWNVFSVGQFAQVN